MMRRGLLMKNLILIVIILFGQNVFGSGIEDRKTLFQGATERLKDSGIEKKIPKQGESFPNVTIKGVSVSDRLKQGPLLLTVYRGGWCPYCMAQLKEIESRLQDFKNKKVQVLAISPETDKEVSKTKKKNNLSIELVSDLNYQVLRKLNLVFKVEDKVLTEYNKMGLDLSQSQGNNNGELPIPATFLIDQKGIIVYSFADADYTKRAKLEDIFFQIKELK